MNDHISHGVSCDCSSSRKECITTTLSCDHDHSVTVVEACSDNCDDEPNLVAPLVPILILSIVQPMGYTIILSYINQVVFELGVVTEPEKVGPYSGFLSSMFCIMVVITMLPWSFLSDRFGRKPVALVGCFGMAIAVTLFGMSSSYLMLVVVICISGCLVGSSATIQVLLAETCPTKSSRITAFSAKMCAETLGRMTGVSLGGYLSHPKKRVTFSHADLWHELPFFLPCIVVTGMSTVACAFGLLIKETRPCQLRVQSTSRDPEHLPLLKSSSEPDHTNIYTSFLTPRVIKALTSNFLVDITAESLYALFLLVAFTPPPAGLGLPTSTIGLLVSTHTALNMASAYISVLLQQRIGPERTLRLGYVCLSVSVVLMRIMVQTESASSTVVNITRVAFLVIWSAGWMVWPSCQVIASESPRSPTDLSLVMGTAEMVQWIGGALSSIIISNLFSHSISYPISTLRGNGNLAYVAILVASAAGILRSFGLERK